MPSAGRAAGRGAGEVRRGTGELRPAAARQSPEWLPSCVAAERTLTKRLHTSVTDREAILKAPFLWPRLPEAPAGFPHLGAPRHITPRAPQAAAGGEAAHPPSVTRREGTYRLHVWSDGATKHPAQGLVLRRPEPGGSTLSYSKVRFSPLRNLMPFRPLCRGAGDKLIVTCVAGISLLGGPAPPSHTWECFAAPACPRLRPEAAATPLPARQPRRLPPLLAASLRCCPPRREREAGGASTLRACPRGSSW